MQQPNQYTKPPLQGGFGHLSQATNKKQEGKKLVDPSGIEPLTSCVQSRRSPS